MEIKYFNKWEFQQALNLAETNPLEAKFKYEQYIKKYPKDYASYSYYAHVLITLGNFEQADKVLDYVENISIRDKFYINQLNKAKLLKNNILINKLRLLSYQEKYDELYRLYLEHSKEIKNMDINSIIFYCKKKIGKIDIEKRDENSYLFRQIVDYKESDFLQHINKHLADYNENTDKPNSSVFVSNFPIDEIIKEIKKHMTFEKRLYPGFYQNIYIFKYNECGRVYNKLTDYFKVICFHDTKDIITMCPAANCQDLPYIDLNYLIHDTTNTKVRRKSQIEKFYQKYKFN